MTNARMNDLLRAMAEAQQRVRGWGQTDVTQESNIVRLSCRGLAAECEALLNGYITNDLRFGEREYHADAETAATEAAQALAAWLVSDDEDRAANPVADALIAKLEELLPMVSQSHVWVGWNIGGIADFSVTLHSRQAVVAEAVSDEDGIRVLDGQRFAVAVRCEPALAAVMMVAAMEMENEREFAAARAAEELGIPF